jgi:hypothetical protein
MSLVVSYMDGWQRKAGRSIKTRTPFPVKKTVTVIKTGNNFGPNYYSLSPFGNIRYFSFVK